MSNPQSRPHKPGLKLDLEPQYIQKSQLNSSSSKMQYSVPKSARFSEKKITFSPDRFYEIPDTKSKRSASFGFGNKVELGKKNFQTPPPSLYNLPSDFNEKRKGITISAGRQVIKSNNVFNTPKFVPGPGQYNPKNPYLDHKTNQGYTIGGRSADITDKWKKDLPGPGNYETIQLLDKNLKSSNSRVKNAQAGKFSKSKRSSDFEQSQKKRIPGPGQYDKAFNIDATAKFKNKGGYHFSHGERQGIISKTGQNIPGPGSYQSFSEFIH